MNWCVDQVDDDDDDDDDDDGDDDDFGISYKLLVEIPPNLQPHASSCGNLVMPQTRRRIGDRACSVAAPRAWNRLLTGLKLLRYGLVSS